MPPAPTRFGHDIERLAFFCDGVAQLLMDRARRLNELVVPIVS